MAKVNGRLVRRSLKTKSYEIAKIKLSQLLVAERGVISLKPDEKLVFEDFASAYEQQVNAKPDLKPGAKQYRIDTLIGIRKTWPGIDKLQPKHFTDAAVLQWADKVREKYSKTRYNGMMQTMKAILQLAVERGLLATNPAETRKRHQHRGIPAARVPIIPPSIPTKEQFHKLLERLDSVPQRRKAAKVVRFLAFCGARIGSARRIYPKDIDLDRNELILPPIKYDQHPRRVPMCPEMRALAEEMLRDYPGFGTLLEIKSPRKALSKASLEAGINPPLTSHDLRHVFATQCIESDVDPRTLGELLGHSDGGRLAMKVYAHVRSAHAQASAAKVNFGTTPKVVDEDQNWEI